MLYKNQLLKLYPYFFFSLGKQYRLRLHTELFFIHNDELPKFHMQWCKPNLGNNTSEVSFQKSYLEGFSIGTHGVS